ncbi:MAG: hypothetical protein J5659_04375 [Clostridia bacterium]|nr:hypothetical protein [Clostridia bacterium]
MKIPEDFTSLTGAVKTDNGSVLFSSNKYKFTYLFDNIFKKEESKITILPEQQFIFGQTHNGFDIAVYLGKQPFEIKGNRALNTAGFILSSGNCYKNSLKVFDAIQFSGGTLNKLFPRDSLRIDFINSKNIDFNDDSVEFSFNINNETIKVKIYSTVSANSGINGSNINTSDVLLRLEFEKKKKIESLFEYYNKLKDVISFLTNRRNVSFEKISIQTKQIINEDHYYNDSGYVYVKEEKPPTNKNFYSNIWFTDIQSALPNLFYNIFNCTEKRHIYSFGFVSETDEDSSLISNRKVQDICTSLESELQNKKEKLPPEYTELISLVKKDIKIIEEKYQLDNEHFSQIKGSMSNWGDSLSDRVIKLYSEHITEILKLPMPGFNIDETAINQFVKYRNDITHGKHRVMTQDIANTAYAMGALSYCAFLSRIGLDSDKIAYLCERKIMS